MPRISTILRTLLGLAFVIFGLNYFLGFIPEPTPPAAAVAFMVPFIGAKYMGVVKVFEIAAGLLLVTNRFVPLALTLLAPILVGITVFHVSLEPSGLPVPLVLIGLEVASAWFYRDAFAPMLKARTSPRTGSSAATVAA